MEYINKEDVHINVITFSSNSLSELEEDINTFLNTRLKRNGGFMYPDVVDIKYQAIQRDGYHYEGSIEYTAMVLYKVDWRSNNNERKIEERLKAINERQKRYKEKYNTNDSSSNTSSGEGQTNGVG